MGESFVKDAAAMGFSPDWDGDNPLVRDERYDRPIEAIFSEESVGWLTEKLKLNCFISQFEYIHIRRQNVLLTEFSFPVEMLSGPQQDIPESLYYADFGGITFHLRDFIDALRHSRVPVTLEMPEIETLIWDPETQTAREVHDAWGGTSELPEVIQRSWNTSDHGRKPILARKSDINHINFNGNINLNIPKFIAKENRHHYCLIYHNRHGIIKNLELDYFYKKKATVVSRTSIYLFTEFGYQSIFSDFYLRANAYRMILTTLPKNLQLYVQKEMITTYEQGLERTPIDFDEIAHSTKLMLNTAMSFSDKCQHQNAALISSGHPCDVKNIRGYYRPRFLTTTPKYYKMAIEHAAKSIVSNSKFYDQWLFENASLF